MNHNRRRCCGALLGMALLLPKLAFAFDFNAATMAGHISYVRLQLQGSAGFSSQAITPDASDPGAWTAPNYPSTGLCRDSSGAEPLSCRSYAIYIPSSYSRKRAQPLYLTLHGNGGFAEQQIGNVPKNNDIADDVAGAWTGLDGRMNELAEAHDFIVVYANGIPNGGSSENGRMWNDCRIGEPASTADDVHFIDMLLDDVMQSLSIDRNRVYAQGYSNGAMMTFRLYAELGARFTAFATAEGNLPKADQTECGAPSARKPLMMVFGTDDIVVPYSGVGIRTSMMSADQTIAYWTQYLGTDAPTTADTDTWTSSWSEVPDVVLDDGVGNTPDSIGYIHVFDHGVQGTEGVGPTFIRVKKILGGGHTQSGSHPLYDSDALSQAQLQAVLGAKNRDIALADELYTFFSPLAMQGQEEPGNTTLGALGLDELLLLLAAAGAAWWRRRP